MTDKKSEKSNNWLNILVLKNNLNSLALAKDFIRGLLATFATKPQSSNIAETADTFNSVYLNRLQWSKANRITF